MLPKELKDECRYCKQDNTDDVCYSYWQAEQFKCHNECKKEGAKVEAHECQKIDADCNDCKHFKRISSQQIKGTSVKWGEGNCLKLNKEVKAFPKYCSSHSCFEHRLD